MKIRNVIFYVKDITLSKRFYEKLGFKLVEDFGKFISFETSDNQTFFSLMQPESGDKSRIPGKQVCAIYSYNIENDLETVRKLGVQVVEDLVEVSYGKTFSINDLDGNKIEYVEETKV
jgi:catechol 2,3-dioxygenase-like lactoylglutathione lyase family enzyme